MIRILHPLYIFLAVLLPIQLLQPPRLCAVEMADIKASLMQLLDQNPHSPLYVESTGPSIEDVYLDRGFEPLWVGPNGPDREAAILLDVLKSARNEGLEPIDYQVGRIEAQWHSEAPEVLADTDILLTTAMHAYVTDLREGRIDPCLKDPYLFTCARDRIIDPVALAARAMAASDFHQFLRDQVPDSSAYRNLRATLASYLEIEKNGGWPMLPEGPALKPGMSDPRVPLIRQRLSATGELAKPELSDSPLLFDDATVEWVMKFQKKHGLEVDGIVGNQTRGAMNVTVSSLIRRIVINMERLRWLHGGTGERHVTVNIASFELSVLDNSSTLLHMPVIVGKNYHETPVFSDRISYIEFNPYWNIPPSIARRDILPKLKSDPAYLSTMGIRVFDGWKEDAEELTPESIQWETVSSSQMGGFKLRQDPGPKNLLGSVKFMFPNRFSVYLHDTPSQELFQRAVRAFSSGCIRLSSPLALAELLLDDNDDSWDMDRIRQTVDSSVRTVVKLDVPVPIHIVYLTVYTNAEGEVCFNKDVYGRDAILEEALFGGNG